MGRLAFDGFLLCAIACAACNGDTTTSGAPTDPFVGRWACSDELSVVFTSPPGIPAEMRTQPSTLNVTASGGVLTASKESDGGSNCKLSFTSNGSTGTLTDGQSCTTSQGLTLAYKSGSATVNGSAMNSTFEFDATGTLSTNGMMVAATATGTQTSTCSRLSNPTTGGGGATTGGW
jgi:hypothetical protein